MFILTSKDNNEYNVYDTFESTFETIDKSKLVKALKLGIKILGAEIIGDKLRIIDNATFVNKMNMLSDYRYSLDRNGLVHLIKIPDIGDIKIDDRVNYIEEEVFKYRSGSLTISGGSGLVDARKMFFHSNDIIFLHLEGLDTSSIKDMSYMFGTCTSLVKLDLHTFNTSRVIDMSYMFYNCMKLIDLNISGFGSNVMNIKGMFRNCERLKNLNISGFKPNNIDDLSELFFNCKRLTKLNLQEFTCPRVFDTSYMFTNCTSIIEIDLHNLETYNISLAVNMFRNCFNLTVLKMNKIDVSFADTSDIFDGCKEAIKCLY